MRFVVFLIQFFFEKGKTLIILISKFFSLNIYWTKNYHNILVDNSVYFIFEKHPMFR